MDIDNHSDSHTSSNPHAARPAVEPAAWLDGPATAQAAIGFIMGAWTSIVLQFAGLSLIGVTHPFDTPRDRTITLLTFLIHLAVFSCNRKKRPMFATVYLVASLLVGCSAILVVSLLSAGWN